MQPQADPAQLQTAELQKRIASLRKATNDFSTTFDGKGNNVVKNFRAWQSGLRSFLATHNFIYLLDENELPEEPTDLDVNLQTILYHIISKTLKDNARQRVAPFLEDNGFDPAAGTKLYTALREAYGGTDLLEILKSLRKVLDLKITPDRDPNGAFEQISNAVTTLKVTENLSANALQCLFILLALHSDSSYNFLLAQELSGGFADLNTIELEQMRAKIRSINAQYQHVRQSANDHRHGKRGEKTTTPKDSIRIADLKKILQKGSNHPKSKEVLNELISIGKVQKKTGKTLKVPNRYKDYIKLGKKVNPKWKTPCTKCDAKPGDDHADGCENLKWQLETQKRFKSSLKKVEGKDDTVFLSIQAGR